MRPVGSKSAAKRQLLDDLKKKFGKSWNPVLRMVEIAEDKETPLELKASLYTQIAQYIEPKRKAIEIDHRGQAEAEFRDKFAEALELLRAKVLLGKDGEL